MSREMERTEVAARESIRDLLAAYTWAGDRGRTAEVAACFTAEGILDVGEHGGTWEGRATIARELDEVARRVAAAGDAPSQVNHHTSSVDIELHDHTSGRVRSYFAVYTDAGPDHWGTYRDEVVLDADDGGWRFARRTVRVTGAAATSRFVSPPGGS